MPVCMCVGDEEVSYWKKVLSSKGKKAVKKERGRGGKCSRGSLCVPTVVMKSPAVHYRPGRKRRQRASEAGKNETGQEEAEPAAKQVKEDDD